MIDGPRVTLGGAERILAPLTLKTLKKISPRLAVLKTLYSNAIPTTENLSLISEMVLASLNRNYPDITMEELDDWLDTGNLMPVFITVLRGSGMQEKSPGEATGS